MVEILYNNGRMTSGSSALVYSRKRRVADAVLRLSSSEVVAVRATFWKQLNRLPRGNATPKGGSRGTRPQAQISANTTTVPLVNQFVDWSLLQMGVIEEN